MRHRTEDGHVRPGLERQPHLGEVDQIDAPRVDDDHLRPVFLDRFLHLQRNDGMVLARVRADNHEHIVQNDLRGRVAHRRGADRLLKRHHRPGVTETRAVVHVIGAEQGAPHLLQQVIIFIRGLGTAVDRHRVRAVAPVDLDQLVGGEVEGGVPIGFDPVPVVGDLRLRDRLSVGADGEDLFPALRLGPAFEEIAAHKGSRHPFGVVNEIVAEASLHTQVALVDRRIERRGDLVNEVILDV